MPSSARKSNIGLDWTIRQKGLLLLAVVFVGELFILGIHFALLQNAEAQAAQEVRARNIIFDLHELGRHRADAAIAVLVYAHAPTPLALKNYEDAVASYGQRSDKLAGELIGSGERESFAVYKQLNDRIFGMMDKAQKVADVGRLDIVEEEQLKKSLRQTQERARRADDTIVLGFQRLQDEGSAGLQSSRGLMRWWLAISVVLNVVAALFLAAAFGKDIVQRLRLMMDNTICLANQKPLNPRVSGRDEIAQLDAVFHDMADALSAAKSREHALMNMVSHDLRTPLTSVQGSLSFISEGHIEGVPEQALSAVRLAERNVDRLVRLVNDYLDMQKISSGKLAVEFANTSLDEVLKAASEAVSALALQKHIAVETSSNQIVVWSDSDKLVQVAVNLLSNAIKFSPANSVVKVTAEVRDDMVALHFCDHGRGIPADQLDLVFSPFHQVESSDGSSGKGSGLGLSICKAIVEELEGSISIMSEEGKGTTFTVTLPKAREQT